MAVNKKIYNKAFYEEQGKRNMQSAEQIFPLVSKLLFFKESRPRICDVGCGTGCWAYIFKKHGCEVLGIDGNPYCDKRYIQEEEFMQHDLREPIVVDEKFDLAICLEVAEHLPKNMSDNLVDFLVSLSDYILFSAAIPFQMGQGHVNEQYQSYWAKKFAAKGYVACDYIRPLIWENKNVRHFYKQNIILYIRQSAENEKIINKACSYRSNLDIIHPDTWEKVQGWLPVKLYVAAYNNPVVYRVYQLIKKIKGKY